MKKNAKKLFTLLFAFAVMAGCMLFATTDAQAATKTHTFKYDSKKGVLWESALRTYQDSRISQDASVYLLNEGDYISKVTATKGMIAKVTHTSTYKENSYTTCSEYDGDKESDERLRFKSYNSISFYAAKEGTYTVKVTIKNAKKKTKCTKSIKVYVGPTWAVDYFSYAGTKSYGDTICSTKASGKVKFKMANGFKLKKVYMATTFDKDGNPNYKKISNNKKITLSKSTKYNQDSYFYEYKSDYSDYYSKSHYYYAYDYIKPVTLIKIVYYDSKLKINKEQTFYIFNIK